MNISNIKVTRFKSLRNTTPEKITNLKEILDDISSDKYKNKIEKIRNHHNPTKNPAKNYLPVFTPTGEFYHRSIKGLNVYNGLICLDLDNLESPKKIKEICKEIPWIISAFITPSGNGLKVLVQTKASKETYKIIENKVAEEFQKLTGVARDNHCKDIARIQFLSYDPEIYINPNYKTFEI